MSQGTNENGLNNLQNNENIQDAIENAFSDLISEYFNEKTTAENVENIESGKVLDWDSVTNGQLYTNLAENQITYGENSSYWDTPIYNTVTGETTEDYEENYNKNEVCNPVNDETIAKNAYGVITVNGDLLKGVNAEGVIENTANVNNEVINEDGTDFKLTQGNLPAKIGFWTKVRNFFMIDSKLSYSVEQPSKANTGIWNKVQNFFSFGKNK